MKGDFSEDTFNPAKHFSRVLMQQGRVQLDADTNEQTAILLHYLRTLAADLIGPFGGPAGEAKGFAITPTKDKKTFNIGKGRYYVDGILCENEEDIIYGNQVDYPNAPEPVSSANRQDLKYLVYLDVWERHITTLEDDDIREKALGGADTASRAKVIWQVKVKKCDTGSNDACSNAATIRDNWKTWVEKWQSPNHGCLRAQVKQSDSSTDPCLTEPEAKYRGSENQLYRVEIHEVSEDKNTLTFKWSRENGSVVTGGKLEGGRLVVGNPHGFTAGNWVEIISDSQELTGLSGTLVKIISVEGDVLRVDRELSMDAKNNWKVRRWDMTAGAMNINQGKDNWFDLENGIQIQFQEGSAHSYRAGDYWLIPARVATGDIEWSDGGSNGPVFLPPCGIHHHYAPLAILTWNGSAWGNITEGDLRCEFHPLVSKKT